MTHDSTPDLAVPPALAAQIVAAAEAQHRPPLDVLRDALKQYLTERQPDTGAQRSPVEAAARMRRARQDNPRLGDAALRDLMTYGRA